MKPSILSPAQLDHREQHIFGIISPLSGRFRFQPMVDHIEFLRLTWNSGLPPQWCCWHRGTTADFPSSVERLPTVSVGVWQQLNAGCKPTTWTEELLQPQDPRPLLESYRQYRQSIQWLRVIPCTIGEANRYVEHFHRHRRPVQAALFAIQATDAAGFVRGVAIIGRPVARLLDVGVDGRMKRRIAEIHRVATDGTFNVSSLLYGAARRFAKDMGFEMLITYTLKDEESGASLRAAGWTCVEETGGTQWNNGTRRRRIDALYNQRKYRWQCVLNLPFPFPSIFQPSSMAEAMPFAVIDRQPEHQLGGDFEQR